MVQGVRTVERVLVAIALIFSMTFVSSLRDSGVRQLAMRIFDPPPLPTSVIDRPGRVAVVVEDESQRPIGGASVRVLWIQNDQAYLAGAAATDAQGTAAISGLPVGETFVLAESAKLSRSSTRFVLSDVSREVRLRLRPAHDLGLVVVDDGGKPVGGASVEVFTGDPIPFGTRTDATGQAKVGRLGPAPWRVKVSGVELESVTEWIPKLPGEPLRVVLRKLGGFDVNVVDGEGRPAGGSVVLVVGSALWPARRTTTDQAGRARIRSLPRGIYDFRATRGDMVAPVEIGIPLGRGETKSMTLSLVAGRRVTVHVTDGDEPDAKPVAAASVVLTESGISPFPLEASTDAAGLATLGPITLGDAFVSARAEGFVSKTGVPVGVARPPKVDVPLMRGGTLRGEVSDARGFPVDGASVEVVGNDLNGDPIDETPERGAFRALHFSWALPGPRELVRVGELGVMPGPIPPIPRAGAFANDLVRRAAPVPGAPPAPPPPEPWVTRDDGTFKAWPVPPGRVRAIVRHPAYLAGVSEAVTLASGGEATVRVVLRTGGTLEGRVVDDRQMPVAGIRVDMAEVRGAQERTTVTADDGTFGFAAVPREMLISISRRDAIDDIAVRTNITVKEGERKEIEITLPPVRDPVKVHVTDERGDPVDGAEVRLLSLASDSPLRRTLFTDRGGDVVFKDAAGLPVRVEVQRSGRATVSRELQAAPVDLGIELRAGLIVTGLVTSRGGRDLVDGAEVTLYTGGGQLRAKSGRDGAFRLQDAACGAGRVVVSRAGYVSADKRVQIEPSGHEDRPIELGPIDLDEGGSIEGEVVDSHGDPVAGARVAKDAAPALVPTGRLPVTMAVTDRRGAFKLGDLPKGETTLDVRAPDGAHGRHGGLQVQAGRTTAGVRIVLGSSQESGPDDARYGLAVTLAVRDKGAIVVTVVAAGSEAERAGLEAQDRIEAIDGRAPASLEDATTRLFGPSGEDVVLDVVRGDNKQKIRVRRERVRQ
jgi:protocatechuate 3,4-dioxygenase beta subunit